MATALPAKHLPGSELDRIWPRIPQPTRSVTPTGVVTTDAEMQKLALHKHTFHGEWNYALHPRPT
jgi:hypothetical protein